MIKISNPEARNFILQTQGLGQAPKFGQGKQATLKCIEHLGYIQIDTISVVERAHHHILWSRVPDYTPVLLEKLVQEKKVFEYWSHAASYLPMKNFRFSLPRKRKYQTGEWHWFKPCHETKKLQKYIIERIKSEGPLTSRDFEAPKKFKSKGWFERKPAKKVLEQLFMAGELMVTRKAFQKVYDLTENVLPSKVDTRFPNESEWARFQILSYLKAQGLAQFIELAYLCQKDSRENIKKELKILLQENILTEVQVSGISEVYYIITDNLKELELFSKAKLAQVHILSPFDNLVIQRKRLKNIFAFDYQIECYVPEHKRKFGYFSLPVLEGNSFIGRLNAKAERDTKELCIQSFSLEKKALFRKKKFEQILNEFAQFNGCPKVT